MKGIILAGGTGSRLWPATRATSKHLLAVWDKPMIFYPLSTLLLTKVREVLVIVAPHQQQAFQTLLGNGEAFGISIEYAVQRQPNGIAEAILIGRDFLDGDSCALVLGDNLFHGDGLRDALQRASRRRTGATVFACPVRDPHHYGVIALDGTGAPREIVEKPSVPPSNLAVTGLYLYDATASERVAQLRPSARGELEITDLNRAYLEDGLLEVEILPHGCAWIDTGTPASLLQAAQFVQGIEERQGLKVGCPEEVAYRLGHIGADALLRSAARYGANTYGRYLAAVARDAVHVSASAEAPAVSAGRDIPVGLRSA